MSYSKSVIAQNVSKAYRIPDSSHLAVGRSVLSRRRTKEFSALSDVTFDVTEGEVLGIIGRNGAGKSTLLKILSRITLPDAGMIRIWGRVGSLLEVGTGFHPELTGRENVYLNGAILGMRRRDVDRHFEDIVEFSDLAAFLDTPVKRYSSGMYVRLAFAVAAHLECDVLICDEVLAVGDAAFQRKTLGRMDEVARLEGRTVLFVSHNMTAVENLCTRVIHLSHGQVQFDGDTASGIHDYLMGDHEAGTSPGSVHLGGRTNATGRLPLTGLVLRAADGRPTATFVMGGPMTVDVGLHCLEGARRPEVGLAVQSDQGQRVLSVNSRMCRFEVARSSAPRHVRVQLPRLPLVPGDYWLDVGVKDDDTGAVLDLVRRAVGFTVMSSNVYGNGYEATSGDGVTYVSDARWSDLGPAEENDR